MLISIPWSSTAYGSQLAIDDNITPNIKIRGKANGSWGDWSQFLLNSNYTNYTVKKDGTGASGTWGIDISGNAATATAATKADSATRATTAGSADAVTWSNVSGKPDSFTPSAHDHERVKLKDATSASSYSSICQEDFLVAYKQEVNIIDVGLRTSFGLLFQDSSLRKQKFGLFFSGQNDIRYVYSREENGETEEYYNILATEETVQSKFDYAKDYADDILKTHKDQKNPHNITLSTFEVTATKDELNILDGITATTQELNYINGVTSNIQIQLNSKAAANHTHSNYASSITTSGSGNAITAISQSGNTITATKGNTFALSNHTHNYAPIVDGLIPSTYLPSYVDDVIQGYYIDGGSNMPGTFYSEPDAQVLRMPESTDDKYGDVITPEKGKIYIDIETNKTYRWSGSKYVEISASLALGETSSTAYAGDKGKALKDKLDGIDDGANKYVHPSYTSKANGLYKITVDSLGHVSATSAVTASDLPSHTHSEYANQNAFSNIKINSGTTPIAATSTTDTFNLIAGNNVTITNNGKNITISSKDNNTTYSLSSSKSANNTNTYLTLTPSSGSSNNIQIKGTGATSISTDSNGVISINSPTVPTIPSLSKGTNTTATKTLAHTGTFTAITGFAVSGHTITPEVTTFTMPSDNNTTYSAGTGISITGTANTITNTGVRSITSGTANGTISVNTNGTTANVEVKGLGSAAYTNSSDYQSAVTGAASTITGSNLTASRALISNASGKVAVSSVTSTELGYLSGVTSAIQTQLDNKPGKIVKTTIGSNTNIGEIFNGLSNTASGAFSHAEGASNTASGDFSHAEGSSSTASGGWSHAEGYYTIASESCSHAEGNASKALAENSHAEGLNTKASGKCSHVEGLNTEASGDYSHVMGKWNIGDPNSTYAFIIGNGTASARSNAFAVDWGGGIWITDSELETAYNALA